MSRFRYLIVVLFLLSSYAYADDVCPSGFDTGVRTWNWAESGDRPVLCVGSNLCEYVIKDVSLCLTEGGTCSGSFISTGLQCSSGSGGMVGGGNYPDPDDLEPPSDTVGTDYGPVLEDHTSTNMFNCTENGNCATALYGLHLDFARLIGTLVGDGRVTGERVEEVGDIVRQGNQSNSRQLTNVYQELFKNTAEASQHAYQNNSRLDEVIDELKQLNSKTCNPKIDNNCGTARNFPQICGAQWTCAGDEYSCFMAKTSWYNLCMSGSGMGDQVDFSVDGRAIQMEMDSVDAALDSAFTEFNESVSDEELDHGESDVTELLNTYNQDNALSFTGSCPVPSSVDLGWVGTFTVSYEPFCDLALYIRAMLMLAASGLAFSIISRYS